MFCSFNWNFVEDHIFDMNRQAHTGTDKKCWLFDGDFDRASNGPNFRLKISGDIIDK
jgi:hypothetical protein